MTDKDKGKPRPARVLKPGPFSVPHWAQDPSAQTAVCHLEVFKEEGVILKRLQLGKKSCFVLGRHQKCDEVLEHVSLSRMHAVFIHSAKHEAGGIKQKPRKDESGEEVDDLGIVLVDLHSSHGTFVNDEQIPPGVAILLFDYDVVRFGGSTRKYKLKGLGLRRPSGHPLVYKLPESADASEEKGKKVEPSPKSHKRSRDEEDKSHKKHKRKESEKESTPKEKEKKEKESPEEPEKVRCSHILVKWKGSRNPSSRLEKIITRSKEEALELITTYRKQIKTKEKTFEEIASASSHCPTGNKQGDLGCFPRGKMQKPFEDASFGLKVGQVSEPVWTDSGVHIIKRTE